MRGVLRYAIVIILAVSPLGSLAAEPASRPASRPTIDLDPVVPLVEFHAMSLEKAIDSLRDTTGVNIVVRWHALKQAGVEPASPVDLRVAKLPLQRVLELLGDAAGAAVSKMPVGVREEQGVLIVSTREDLTTDSVVRHYDVRELIASDMAVRARAPSPRATTTPAPEPSAEELYDRSLEQLNHVIMETIDPESWRDAGGTVGSIHDFNGLLVIAQTPANHERITKLLDELRRK